MRSQPKNRQVVRLDVDSQSGSSYAHMHPTWNEEKLLEAKAYLDKNGTQHNGTGDLRDLDLDIGVLKLDCDLNPYTCVSRMEGSQFTSSKS